MILAPAGAITDIAVPAFGYSHSSYGENKGWSLTAAGLPSISTSALSDPTATAAQKFPVIVFAELTGVTHLTDSIDAGVRLTAQFTTADFAGQKQIVAFIRAVMREPRLLILDEATANIDTVTEQLLEDILRDLPSSTTKVVIAHRLNTIENADEILFINAGEITRAGSMQDALDLLLHHKRES